MRLERRNRVQLALQLLLGEQLMDLRMAWTTDADDLPDDHAFELALVAFVVVARPRDQVMTRQRLLATADRALPLHTLAAVAAPPFERELGDA